MNNRSHFSEGRSIGFRDVEKLVLKIFGRHEVWKRFMIVCKYLIVNFKSAKLYFLQKTNYRYFYLYLCHLFHCWARLKYITYFIILIFRPQTTYFIWILKFWWLSVGMCPCIHVSIYPMYDFRVVYVTQVTCTQVHPPNSVPAYINASHADRSELDSHPIKLTVAMRGCLGQIIRRRGWMN